MTSSLREFDDNESRMIIVATIAQTLSSKFQPSSSRNPLSPRGHDMMTNHNTRHGIVYLHYCAYGVLSYKYNCTKNPLQNRPTNQPFIIDDLDDDVFLQALLEESIHTLKAYFQALEERDIQVGYMQNNKNPSKEKASKSFWLAFKSFEIKIKGNLFMETSVKKNSMDLYTQRDTIISVKCIELELARVTRHDTLTMYTPSDICCEFEIVDLLYRKKWD
jgi:hypothetical protein